MAFCMLFNAGVEMRLGVAGTQTTPLDSVVGLMLHLDRCRQHQSTPNIPDCHQSKCIVAPQMITINPGREKVELCNVEGDPMGEEDEAHPHSRTDERSPTTI